MTGCRFLIFMLLPLKRIRISIKLTIAQGSWVRSRYPAPSGALEWHRALERTMELWLWSLYFLPVSGALRVLPEVRLDGELGGSIIIQCPLPGIHSRMYLCRQMTEPGSCTTVVSNMFTKKEYWNRVTLEPCSDKNLFVVEIMKLTESDSGIYACGWGRYTDLGKTQKIILNVHNAYEPFLEEEKISGSSEWLHSFLHVQIPKRLQGAVQTNSGFLAAVTTPAESTEGSPAHHASPTTPAAHYAGVSRTSSVAAAQPSTPPTTTASQNPTQEGMFRPQVTNYHTRERSFYHRHGSRSGSWDQGFHILVPTILGLLLLALLWLVIKRAIRRRKAFSRQVRRLARRVRTPESVQQPRAQRTRGTPRPRSQNNVYSACPRRPRGPDTAGQGEAAPSHLPASVPPQGPPQEPEAPRLLAQPLKASCDYVSLCHPPAVKMEDTDSGDYVNIPNLTHLPSCSLGPRPWCQ
ncbi:fas apoptotic inhibitory molecule 3 isoform X2 [Perognathus longimembris pacificus]|uniref:fas apoptotic inhibitory molecule 3 isoform X2 n=1 Tax=Perognathus longimembris pacificus TaxID=214514 RepID=UPI0020189F47|nr:fas apoptotic inhibitory molecule 3 isoform X2 [Perognathus longimembris pacificus]